MRKWILLVPAIASLAVGTYILVKKDNEDASDVPEKKGAEKKEVLNPKTGSYSFVSGFKDARTVGLEFTYDADRFSYRQIEEDFLTFTSVSHAAAIYGEDFNIQIEYADLAGGEDFAALADVLREKKTGFAPVCYGDNSGYMYYNGDNVCFVFPATKYSYILITVIKDKNSDIDYRDLPDDPDVAAILGSIRIL
ncbi:MAG: hypothetical protein IJH53_08860 [Oscillospiraceae bacterium]|nr:hypothetical protein [Oscillospiraceae bacterium]